MIRRTNLVFMINLLSPLRSYELSRGNVLRARCLNMDMRLQ